jgi:hypothetical protein
MDASERGGCSMTYAVLLFFGEWFGHKDKDGPQVVLHEMRTKVWLKNIVQEICLFNFSTVRRQQKRNAQREPVVRAFLCPPQCPTVSPICLQSVVRQSGK